MHSAPLIIEFCKILKIAKGQISTLIKKKYFTMLMQSKKTTTT